MSNAPFPATILGFNVGGFSWVASELALAGVTERHQLLELTEDAAFSDARCTAEAGGQCLRLFAAAQELVTSPEFTSLPFYRAGNPPFFTQTVDQKLERLDGVDSLLDRLLANLSAHPGGAPNMDFELMGSYLRGVAKWNQFAGDTASIRILLTFVELPPRWILDTPSAAICKLRGRNYSFESLWHKWILLYIQIARRTIRFVANLSAEFTQELLAAVEIINEPDYEWLPDEFRIEKSLAPTVNPFNKYVTELHMNQIPDLETSTCIQQAPWGGIQMQDGEWGCETVRQYPLLEFPWGAKLDWYIKAFANLHMHVSWAVRDELHQRGSTAKIVSCSVTHNNVLYLAQMYRINPECFAYVDAIGVHPYHFPGHDIWNDQFVNAKDYPEWKSATPRSYAKDCFKRFDFIEEISKLTKLPPGPESFGLSGKKIWITEFGIPTKSLGKFNREHPEYVPFIRRRCEPPVGNWKSAVWEDLWDAFLLQAKPGYLKDLGVEGFFLYALRETTVAGFDKHDDDRSNFALYSRDGRSRMDSRTQERLQHFMTSMTGCAGTQIDPLPRIASELGCSFDSSIGEIAGPTSMLSSPERRLLYALARDYCSGSGVIVDAGCFLGGSTTALAGGLRDRARGLKDRARRAETAIHSFDPFEADTYVIEHYLPAGEYAPGGSFLQLYERNIEPFRELIQVHAGDIRNHVWTAGPIELLFIDIAKTWETNDHLVAEYFPHLIPGRSVVVQQDYVHQWCPWLHVTMEALAEYFKPLGFVEHNTVLYRLERPIPQEFFDVPVSAYPWDQKLHLMHRSVLRFFGAQRGVVECAEVVLLCEAGRGDEALRKLRILERRFAGHPELPAIIQSVFGLAQSVAGGS